MMTTRAIWSVPLLAIAACSPSAGGNNAAAPGNLATAGPTASMSAAQGDVLGPERQPDLPAGLDCVRLRLTPEQRMAAGEAVMDRNSAYGDRRAAPLLQAAESCGRELSWSQRKRELAVRFSLASAGVSGVQRWFASRGIHIEDLDEMILSDREMMASAETGQFPRPVSLRFALRHDAQIERLVGGRPGQREMGEMVGSYSGFRALAEVLAFKFERER